MLPKRHLVVFTGVSGSGKSSLAFDTLFAEGQRRYVESLSAYARQFLGQMDKPDVDQITGLSPTIAIEQKTVSRNPRSTVGTVTEINDYLRVLFARTGRIVAGFCLLFIGLDTMQDAMQGAGGWITSSWAPGTGLAGMLAMAGLGLVITVVMQSSSAAIAVGRCGTGRGSFADFSTGSSAGPTSTKSLCMIGWRTSPNPSAMNLRSDGSW